MAVLMEMKFTADKLAAILGGEVVGDPDAQVTSFSKIENGKKGQLCFFANPKYEKYVYSSNASILLVNRSFVPKEKVAPTMVRVDDAYAALAVLLDYVSQQRRTFRRRRSLLSRVALSANLGKKVWVGDFVSVGPGCVIGDRTRICDNVTIGSGVKIGSDCIIYPGVSIFPGMVIGDRVILHSGCVIGDDGFGNAPQEDGSWKKIEHMGNVVIGNDVEIGSNTTVDKAPMGSTVIGNGVRIDNLCQIAHNVVIGDNTVMAAQTGIAGSTKIGRNCILAGQVGIAGHLTIADNTTIGAKSGIIGNVGRSGEVLFGNPAIGRTQFMRAYVKFRQSGKE